MPNRVFRFGPGSPCTRTVDRLDLFRVYYWPMLLDVPTPLLSAAGVQIRPWRIDDLHCIEAAATDPTIPTGTTVPAVYSVDAGIAFIERQHARLTDGEGISQAIVENATGRSVGLIYLSRRPQPWIAGLGYWLIPDARGRHLAASAIRLVTEWALEHLDVVRVEAWVAPDNVPSQRVLGSAGFVCEGTLRNFLRLPGQGATDGLVFSRVGGG